MLSLPRICLLALCLAGAAHADDQQRCDETMLDALAGQLNMEGWALPENARSGTLVASACKPWPDDEKQTVVAVAYTDRDEHAAPGERNVHLLLAKADTRSGRLLSEYREDIGEDAMWEVGANSLRIDTARYHLAPGVRAFGINFHSAARGASCPDGWANNLLTLVVPEGRSLRPVFRTYLDQWESITPGLCPSDQQARVEASHLTIGIGKGKSAGFADLEITSHVTESDETVRTVKRVLRYDGKQYPFEEWSTFWMSTTRENDGAAEAPAASEAPQ
ncbi:hypothetical protein [Enterobacillus tribolii]|uniref:Uncharacterized protein n=1 Tax=Enterobacillus tribolii TaxID=1487935 RepID=A0A370QGD4_9GAMM|nr:hypothetical protein [Enterobacillus tribolii]RDK87422.1 hypothetical protein C8D90_10917 [Enterobacillus tribolii]